MSQSPASTEEEQVGLFELNKPCVKRMRGCPAGLFYIQRPVGKPHSSLQEMSQRFALAKEAEVGLFALNGPMADPLNAPQAAIMIG